MILLFKHKFKYVVIYNLKGTKCTAMNSIDFRGMIEFIEKPRKPVKLMCD